MLLKLQFESTVIGLDRDGGTWKRIVNGDI